MNKSPNNLYQVAFPDQNKRPVLVLAKDIADAAIMVADDVRNKEKKSPFYGFSSVSVLVVELYTA